MKKTKVLLLAAAGVLMAGGAFSEAPSSNTKTVTGGLIEDGLVDSFDTGVEGKDTLFFGSYGMSDGTIRAGYGKRFNPKLWISLYDGWYMNAGTQTEETSKKDSVSLDGVNTDYTDSSASAQVSGNSRVKNNLAFSTYLDNKIGGTFYWNIDSSNLQGYAATDPTGMIQDKSGTTTTKDSSENHEDGTTSLTEYSTLENKKSENTFGINFNGIQTKYLMGERKLYFKLNTFQFTKSSRFIDLAWNTKTTLNSSTIDSSEQPSYKGTYNYNTYTPYLEVEAGFSFKKIWDCVTPQFTLTEGFQMSFRSNENTYTYSKNTANTALLNTRQTTSFKMDQGDYSNWKNTLTPRFDFDFDLGENITLKTRAQAGISLSNTFTGADKYTTITTTRTKDLTNGDTTVTKKITTSGAASETEIFTTTVSPEFDLGLVYRVIPGKFNINVGVSASSGSLEWKKTVKTNSNIPETSVTTFTNTAGETTVTGKSYTAKNGDGAGKDDAEEEKQTNSFSAATPDATARFGFTWFLGEKAQLDSYMIYGTSAGTTNPTWAMNIMFAVKI